MRAHIIGVVVSDTTSEIMTATYSVSANSLNRRPTMPPKKTSGAKTAISDSVIERTVKPTSPAPLSDELAAVQVEIAVLDMDQRVDCRALGSSKPDVREQERPAMQLEEGTTAALGPGLPGEPFRVAVHRRLDADFQDQPVAQPDRRRAPWA